MTYREAIAQGMKPRFTSYQRCYVSRKVDVQEQPLIAAGGYRKGYYYVEAPCWHSTQYSYRIYLA